MSTELATTNDREAIGAELFNKLILQNDLSKLTEVELVQFYKATCKEVGLSAIAKPFDVLILQGKKTLYANKNCTAQLTALHKPSVTIVSKGEEDGMYVVVARCTKADGSEVDDIGAAPYLGMTGDNKVNAILKAVTKAKRRAILSAFGLGSLDVSELETIQDAQVVEIAPELLDDQLNDAVETWYATLEGVTEVEDLDKCRIQIKELDIKLRESLRPIMESTQKRLGVIWKNKQYVKVQE